MFEPSLLQTFIFFLGFFPFLVLKLPLQLETLVKAVLLIFICPKFRVSPPAHRLLGGSSKLRDLGAADGGWSN